MTSAKRLALPVRVDAGGDVSGWGRPGETWGRHGVGRIGAMAWAEAFRLRFDLKKQSGTLRLHAQELSSDHLQCVLGADAFERRAVRGKELLFDESGTSATG